MDQNVQKNPRYRMIGFAVATVSLLGWLLALYFWSVSAETENALVRQRSLTGSVADLETRIMALRTQAARAEGDREVSISGLRDVEQSLDEARANLATLESEVQRLNEARETLQAEIGAGEDTLTTLEQNVAQNRQAIAETSQELSDVGARLNEARAQEAEVQSRISSLSAELAEMTSAASDAEQRVQAAREAEASLEQRVLTARQELEELEKRRTATEEAVTSLVQRRDDLSADTTAAEEQIQALHQVIDDLSGSIVERSEHLSALESRIATVQQQGGQSAMGAAAGLMPSTAYTHDDVTAIFAPDGTFKMENTRSGEAVEGTYSLADDMLTLDEIKGDLGAAQAPIRCSIAAQATGFTLADADGSCGFFDAAVFSRRTP